MIRDEDLHVIISDQGFLNILRCGVWTLQWCPYNGKGCGDRCPKFQFEVPLSREHKQLNICGTILRIRKENFTDERREIEEDMEKVHKELTNTLTEGD